MIRKRMRQQAFVEWNQDGEKKAARVAYAPNTSGLERSKLKSQLKGYRAYILCQIERKGITITKQSLLENGLQWQGCQSLLQARNTATMILSHSNDTSIYTKNNWNSSA